MATEPNLLSKRDYLIDFRRMVLTFGVNTPIGGAKAAFALTNGCVVTATSQGN